MQWVAGMQAYRKNITAPEAISVLEVCLVMLQRSGCNFMLHETSPTHAVHHVYLLESQVPIVQYLSKVSC